MANWTDEQFKVGGASKAWDDSTVNWADPLYEWDGQTSTVWSDESKH